MLIVIIGPDGSGKTTLAKSIFKNYKNKFKEIKLFEFRYGVLPTLSFCPNIVQTLSKACQTFVH